MAVSLTDPNVDTHSTTDATTYSSGSWTPPANALLVCWVINRSTVDTPTSVTGHGATYTRAATVTDAAGLRMHLYVADSGGSPSAGTDDVVFAATQGGCHVMVHAFQGVDLSGGAVAAIVQSVVTALAATGTSGSLTLAAAGNAANRPISAWAHRANEVTTPATNWTEIDDGQFPTTAPSSSAECQWRSDAFDTAAAASWTTSIGFAGIAAELKASLVGPTPIPRIGPDRRAGN